MAIYTITYKFTYVYGTVRSLHIQVKIFKHGCKHETPAIPVSFKCSREKDVLYGKTLCYPNSRMVLTALIITKDRGDREYKLGIENTKGKVLLLY